MSLLLITPEPPSGTAALSFQATGPVSSRITLQTDGILRFYSAGDGFEFINAAGTTVFDISESGASFTQIDLGNGTAAAPSLAFLADDTTGIYRAGANQMNISVGGTLRVTFSTTAVTSTVPLLGPNGTAAAPSFGFSGDAGDGLYRAAADSPAIAVAGAEHTRFSSAGLTLATGQLRAPDGTAALPAYTFASDSDDGFYRAGASAPAVSVAGVEHTRFSSAGITLATGQLLIPNGTAVAPALSASAEATGLYFAASKIGIGINSSERAVFNSSGLGIGATPTKLFQIGTAPDGTPGSTLGATFRVNDPGSSYAVIVEQADVTGGNLAPTLGVSRLSSSTSALLAAFYRGNNTNDSFTDLMCSITTEGSIRLADGTVSIPAFTFDADRNTGLYRIGADNPGLAAGGVLILQADTTNNISIRLGTASATAVVGGAVNVNTTAVGNVDAGEDDLMTYSLPANALNKNGRGVRIRAWGSVANVANTKALKLYFGATVLVTVTASATSGANNWVAEATVLRTGSNTQDGVGEIRGNIGAAAAFSDTISTSTPTETDAGAITIKMTGEATSNNDIIQEGMVVEVLN